jgi:hypothetical protein
VEELAKPSRYRVAIFIDAPANLGRVAHASTADFGLHGRSVHVRLLLFDVMLVGDVKDEHEMRPAPLPL